MTANLSLDAVSEQCRHRQLTPPLLCGYAVTQHPLSQVRADALAAVLDLDLDSGVCYACLGIVSFALDKGDPVEIARELRGMTPYLWADGLAEHALAAVRGACDRGLPDAEAALADLEQRGGRSPVARAIVRRLAGELSRRTRTEMRIEALARDRLGLAPPELN
jgi:hypothetical protein